MKQILFTIVGMLLTVFFINCPVSPASIATLDDSGDPTSDDQSFSIECDYYTSSMVEDEDNLYMTKRLSVIIEEEYLYYWEIEKRSKLSGELVTDFGIDGIVTSPVRGIHSEKLNSIKLNGDYILAVGEIEETNYPGILIIKLNKQTGEFIEEFCGDGIYRPRVVAPTYKIFLYDIETNGSTVFIAGKAVSATDSTDYDFYISKMDFTTGELVTGFGTGGVFQGKVSGINSQFNDIIIDNVTIWAVGSDSHDPGYGNLQWLITAVEYFGGIFDEDFNDTGTMTINMCDKNDNAKYVAKDLDSIYVAGTSIQYGRQDSEWVVRKISKKRKTFIDSFTVDNFITSEHTFLRGLTVFGNCFYLHGGNGGFDSGWRIEKRYCDDGSLVRSFGTDGVWHRYQGGTTSLNELIVNDDYVYMLGTEYKFIPEEEFPISIYKLDKISVTDMVQ